MRSFGNVKKDYFMPGPLIRAASAIAIVKSGIIATLHSFSETDSFQER